MLKKTSLHPLHTVRIEVQVRHSALLGAGGFGVVQAANFQRFFALFPAPANALDLDNAGLGRSASQGVFGLQVDEPPPATYFHIHEFADLKAKSERLQGLVCASRKASRAASARAAQSWADC